MGEADFAAAVGCRAGKVERMIAALKTTEPQGDPAEAREPCLGHTPISLPTDAVDQGGLVEAPRDNRAGRHANLGNMATAAAKPQFLTVCEAAALLNVNEQTIQRWIDAESIPYLELSDNSYRIPQSALLASLWVNYDLAAEFRELNERNAELTDEQVQAQLEDK